MTEKTTGMRLLTIILLSLFFSVTATGENRGVYPVDISEYNNEDRIENELQKNLFDFAKDLRESCFEIPQNASANNIRPQQTKLTEHLQESSKFTSATALFTSSIPNSKLLEIKVATTSSRHRRGYYIYAIRHIII